MHTKADPRLSNVWLVSFADSRLVKPRVRLMRQARQFGIREGQIFICDETSLDPDFCEKMKNRLVLGSKGFGYWCWKPEICLERMRAIPEGDILIYIDIGDHLNPRGKPRFYEYLDVVVKKGFCGFQSRSLLGTEVPDSRYHVYLNSEFTKGDLLDYFGVRNRLDIINAGQMAGNAFFMRKSEESLAFLKEWAEIYFKDFSLMDDTPSKSPNLPGFLLHRHDQSAFSIMWLLHGYPTISGCEVEPLRKYASAPKEFRHDKNWGPAWFWQM